MADDEKGTLKFDRFTVIPAERQFIDAERPVRLPPRVFDTLVLLVRNAGKVLSKDEIMRSVWPDSFVEENNLAQNISLLRRVLGETKDKKFIETVPKFGYRFLMPRRETAASVPDIEVERAIGDPTSPIGQMVREPEALVLPGTRYAQNGDVNLAYQVVGEGPVDIVFVMGWVSHLEYFWKHHLFASFLRRLASFSRLILFDKRGTGLSDRVPLNELPTLEQRMEDLHAVMDAAGSERAFLFGVSEGGPMCALFAATYPERTAGLMMFGTYAKRTRDVDYPWAPEADERSKFFETVRRDWGKPVGVEERAPSMANDREFCEWWAAYLRMGASPGAAVALTKMNAEIDVRSVLPLVRVPTLVMHRKGDLCLRVDEGRYVASRIPGSKFVEFDGDDHLPFVGDHESVINAVAGFMSETVWQDVPERVLATVMTVNVVDIEVRSIRQRIERSISLFRGSPIDLGSDNIVATFDGPARAIRCGLAIIGDARRSGDAVRVGLHTGECDVVGGRYGGVASELSQRIAAFADEGTVVVSRTVKDLVAGSGIGFNEIGLRSFEGIEGEWRLFDVID